ncbi:Condensin complex subunit 1 [Cyphellophora attinorum]|uniref:Condensin complex subunit 1 n=1 Tax=Cyphellophora attinorum TaxID=1664694 RepID=A0A0N1HWH9_9EURO|nr:Condensin complex subunit 1 [Phialophora attinorum]KPI44556.1 Condensin complex subunit 1 [Phialophora attinorum]
MEGAVEFDINESLKLYLSDPASIQTSEASAQLTDCENDPDSLTPGLIDGALEPIQDALVESPENILRPEPSTPYNFYSSSRISVIHTDLFAHPRSSSLLPPQSLSKILEIIVSGLATVSDNANADIENDEQDALPHHKKLLEAYAFLLQWTIAAVEAKAAEKAHAAPARRGKGSTKKTASKGGVWESAAQIQAAMDIMCRAMRLKLNRIFETTSDRDTFINLFTRSIYLIMETEARMKITAVRMFCFKVLCVAVKHHGHAIGAQTSIVQNLTYFEHLSDPMAEFLHILSEQYDYPQLSSEIMRELAAKDFSPSDLKGPKSVSAFIIKLSELEPRLVIKEMGLLAKFLDSEAYTLRCAVIEVCGNLLADLNKIEDRDETTNIQIDAFFDTLEQRFLDTNPYCRCRAIQVFMRLCELDQRIPKRRQHAAELAVQSLQDKSSNVRRNAIKLLGKLVATHPFSVMHGGELQRKAWIQRLEGVDQQLDALKPPPDSPGLAETAKGTERAPAEMTEEEQIEAAKKAQEEAATTEVLTRLQLTRKYYIDALRFIDVIHEASETACQLLSARNKSEVLEAMDFFVIINAYKVEPASIGIRRMLRLIWTKGNSDEGKGVQTHLIDCYKGLFFDAPEVLNANDTANFIARNMISLTFGASPAELTSLEQLLSTMYKSGHVSDLVIAKLWQVYGVNREISRAQRRGAIIVLGMIALADPNVVVKESDAMMRIGLGQLGRADLTLAKFTCVALKRMIPPPKKAQDKTQTGISRIATTTIPSAPTEKPKEKPAITLSQLLFMVGHIAIKQIVHLELCELDFKRRKHDQEKEKPLVEPTPQPSKRKKTVAEQVMSEKEKQEEKDELELIGGTNEDDFTEAVAHIRERELLYGPSSLLANFGPLVTEVCANNMAYKDRNLQAHATLCLAKLMCVSSEYCEKNLPLLITILERSEDPIARSNTVIALGDMAVCFNHLIDENTDFLYRRLNDGDESVKRTCLMTLTFLILAGQVKVKGQLGEMAKCLEDGDKRIADLARMFFTELATKDNALYNQFIDMFSILTRDGPLEGGVMEEEALKRILKFLCGFIEKDKHAKNLAEKLAARLDRCESERQWNDTAYALSLLQHKNEDIAKKVSEGYRVVETAA